MDLCCPEVIESQPAYDELSHEVDKNVLTVRVGKKVGKIEKVYPPEDTDSPTLTAHCEDGQGNRCRPGCAKVNVFPNKAPPAKLPDEEYFLLRATRQMIPNNDEMRNVLEIELRTPRNYEPLAAATATPEPNPEPPVADDNHEKGPHKQKNDKKKKRK